MAVDNEGIERTEAPSPRVSAQWRARGLVPRSRELVAASVLCAGAFALRGLGPRAADNLMELTGNRLARVTITSPGAELSSWYELGLGKLLLDLLPLFLVPFLAAAIVGTGQGGMRIHPHQIWPDLTRLDPIAGIQRILCGRSLQRGLISLGKWSVLVALAAWSVSQEIMLLERASGADTIEFASRVATALLRGVSHFTLWLLGIGVLDYALAWRFWHRQMQMSRPQLAAEQRETEGDPILRRRRRERQSELARNRLHGHLETEDVVLLGKGRLGVALRPHAIDQFVLVGKAIGPACAGLRSNARRSGARTLQQDALARSIFDSGRVGEPILDEAAREIRAALDRRGAVQSATRHAGRSTAASFMPGR